jgi:hypothetical protein
MGGDPTKNVLSNLVWVESDLNELMESDAETAQLARARGIKIPRWMASDGAPIFHAAHGGWVLLGDDGSVSGHLGSGRDSAFTAALLMGAGVT